MLDKEKALKAIAAAKFDRSKITEESVLRGMEVELEHIDVVGDDYNKLAKIALAHLNELPDYYERLKAMEGDSSNCTMLGWIGIGLLVWKFLKWKR